LSGARAARPVAARLVVPAKWARETGVLVKGVRETGVLVKGVPSELMIRRIGS